MVDPPRSWFPLVGRRLVVFAIIGTAYCGFLLAVEYRNAVVPPPDSDAAGYTYPFSPPHDEFEVLINQNDGQAYTLLAQDPTFEHPEVFFDGARTLAYFAQKPLIVYLVWAGSLGQPNLVPIAFIIITTLIGGLYAMASAALTQTRYGGEADRLSLLCLIVPGALATYFFSPNLLAVALGTLGLVCWHRPSARAHALGALFFVLACLGRETMLLFPLVTGLLLLFRWQLTIRDAALLASPVVVLVGWYALVRAHIDAPADQGLVWVNFRAPFLGIIDAMPMFGPAEWFNLAVVLACIAVAIWRLREDDLMWHALAWAVLAIVLSGPNWRIWEVGRLFVPLYLFPVLSCVGAYRGEAALRRQKLERAAI